MENFPCHQAIFRSCAQLLTYPDEGSEAVAARCAEDMSAVGSEGSVPMRIFLDSLATMTLASLEEQFTKTFDLQPVCHPYVGYQLFGESQQRTLFLIRLQQLYQDHEFNVGIELPDHVATMLRFVGSMTDQKCRQEIVCDGLLPALGKIVTELEVSETPYRHLVISLQHFLAESAAVETEPMTASGKRS